MMKLLTKLLFSFLLAMTAATAAAQTHPADAEGTQEHPAIKRYPNFYIDKSQYFDFNEFGFPLSAGEQLKAGKFWFVEYTLVENARRPSSIELIRNYENAFKKAGGTALYRDDINATYRMPLGQGGERWMYIYVINDGNGYQLTIVDVSPMEQKVEFSSDQMAEAINTHGFVALNGILFDTGKAVVKPESEALLKEIVALLNNDKALRLAIVGHTDNVGDKKANLELSKKRAASVVQQLVAAGIDAKRLKADGRGDTEPVADNRREDGRASNRRVELVKQ